MVSKHLSSLAFNIVNWYVRVKRVDLSWGGSVCYCAVGVMLPTFSVAPFTHLCHCFAEMGVDNIELDDSVYKNMSRPTIVCQQFLVVFSLVLNLSIPDVPFPVLLSTFIRSRFQAKPATLLIPIDFPFLFAVEELYGTRYQSGSFSLLFHKKTVVCGNMQAARKLPTILHREKEN